MSTVFIFGDVHAPFHNKKKYALALKHLKQSNADTVIQIGDMLDLYNFSRFSRSLNVSTPKAELKKAIQLAEQFWRDVKKIRPKAKCIQFIGNHEARLKKRILEKTPELESLFDLRKFFQFPGVKTMRSDRDFLEIDGVVYCHGWLGQSIKHAEHFGKPCVHGHLHRPCLITKGKRLWSMDVGYLGDEKQLPMSYTASKVTGWRHACGTVTDGKPRLILL